MIGVVAVDMVTDDHRVDTEIAVAEVVMEIAAPVAVVMVIVGPADIPTEAVEAAAEVMATKVVAMIGLDTKIVPLNTIGPQLHPRILKTAKDTKVKTEAVQIQILPGLVINKTL